MIEFIRNLFKTKQQKEVEKIAQEIVNAQNDLLLEIIKDTGRARFKFKDVAQDVQVHTYVGIIEPGETDEDS
jgi:myo-inositol catabolism protein IolC